MDMQRQVDLQYCEEKHEKGWDAIISDGIVVGFVRKGGDPDDDGREPYGG